MAVVGLGGPDDEPASISCPFMSSAFSARVTRSRAPRRASNCSSRNVRVAPVPFFSARRYLCAIVEAVAWLNTGPTDACGVPTSGLPDPFSGRVFIPAPFAPWQVHPSTLHESEVYVLCRGARARASASGLSPKLRLHPPEQTLEGCRTPCRRRLFRTLWSPTPARWAHADMACRTGVQHQASRTHHPLPDACRARQRADIVVDTLATSPGPAIGICIAIYRVRVVTYL